ncbi:MAG TPA: ABC transporter permease [Gemmatimonadaceae bacterium]
MRFDRETLARIRGQLFAHVLFSMRLAVVAVAHNKLRAGLTSLGILFGVASVIAMLAIGKGAEQEILEQMKLLGSNNILITPIVEQKEGNADKEKDEKQKKRFTPGLTYSDAEAIRTIVPNVETTTGEVVLNSTITREGHRRSGKLVGVDTTYFRLNNLELSTGGWYTLDQVQFGRPVAIIGDGVRGRFFTKEEAIGRSIKVGGTWLTVVGVLRPRVVSAENSQRLGIRDANMDVYVPIHTVLTRFRNRAMVTQQDIEQASRPVVVTTADDPQEDETTREERLNRNQLDRIIVRVGDSRYVASVAAVVRRMLERRHNSVVDFEITVPELLLKQEQRTKTIFNVVLGAIASISLIVGGIGIMNIMLASVLERIREIGVRRAMGATQRDILMQFLSEAVLISVTGGVAGIMVGGGLSIGIEQFAGIKTIVSFMSVFVAFSVSLSVGIIFGIVPAYRAARQDPVTCLRYE